MSVLSLDSSDSILPNPDLIPFLLERYYKQGEKVGDRDLVSSHWDCYSRLFEVNTDNEGENCFPFPVWDVGVVDGLACATESFGRERIGFD